MQQPIHLMKGYPMTVLTAPEIHFEAAGPPGSGIQWHRICHVDVLEDAWGEAALVEDHQLALFRLSATEVYAVDQRDPATGAHVMSRGIVGTKGVLATIASPLHKEVYVLRTGECLSDADLHLRTYPVRVDNGQVVIGIGIAGDVGAAA